mmetsp:Transcript_26586/g.48883  ORF Transcript_26586/g.48883 Transcript_26586/m.48883 type:complete len:264 (+) Transcript_26586:444-1235(+)
MQEAIHAYTGCTVIVEDGATIKGGKNMATGLYLGDDSGPAYALIRGGKFYSYDGTALWLKNNAVAVILDGEFHTRCRKDKEPYICYNLMVFGSSRLVIYGGSFSAPDNKWSISGEGSDQRAPATVNVHGTNLVLQENVEDNEHRIHGRLCGGQIINVMVRVNLEHNLLHLIEDCNKSTTTSTSIQDILPADFLHGMSYEWWNNASEWPSTELSTPIAASASPYLSFIFALSLSFLAIVLTTARNRMAHGKQQQHQQQQQQKSQ